MPACPRSARCRSVRSARQSGRVIEFTGLDAAGGGGWRIHGRNSAQKRAVDRARTAGAKAGDLYRRSIVDGFSRLAYTEPLDDEKGTTAAAFLAWAKVWFAAHGITHIDRIVTDNGARYRSNDFAPSIPTRDPRHQRPALKQLGSGRWA